ncbi:hypothetical protein J2X36_005292 [Methylobacterium sp. BE186]|uniref:hypothetical protein n=1 Tax=Methylobacterium sp. BE186 TaxID=2817715 RepID=UPI002856421E|nr:hypothetical protein [Methylobacterium sp. BE186]MDR7040509.1 hypothetical protein [Methylobacterium sp. BE186]
MARQSAQGAGKSAAIAFRTTPEVRDRLTRAAEAGGRSLAQEIERRIELSFGLDFIEPVGAELLSKNAASRRLFRYISEVFGQIVSFGRDRGYNEVDMRKDLRAALDVAKFYFLWTGIEEPPKVEGPKPAPDARPRELPPGHFGAVLADERIVWGATWHQESIPDDTIEGRISDHWSGNGEKLISGPSREDQDREREAALVKAKEALARGEIEFVPLSDLKARKRTPSQDK